MIVVLGLATVAGAQSAGTGAIAGQVTDEKGGAVAGAKATVRNAETNVSRELETDAQGEYRAVLLQPGNYEVTVQAPGFGTLRRSGIRVEVGSTAAVDIQLKLAAVTEVVTVTAAAPITDPEKVEVTNTVTQKQIEELPINGRRWDNFVLLTPGVSMDGTFGLISSRGISGLLNNNTIDGADNNQAFFSEARGRTRVSYTYSQDAVKEFQVGLSTFSAEFGRAAGGTINAVTKSGTNELHGDVFYYIRDDVLQAREPTLVDPTTGSPLKNKSRRQQYGLSLGFPFIKDKLFFFGNFDQQLWTETPLSTNSGTNFFSNFTRTCVSAPPLAANCTALQAFLVSETGHWLRKKINNVALGKLDWVINPKHTLTGSYNWQRWKAPNGIQATPQVLTRGISDNGFDGVKTDSLVFRLNSVLGARTVNEAKFQYGRDFEFQTPNATDPRTTITDGVSFGMSEFLPRPAWPDEKRFQWTDTYSRIVGRHTLKAGLDINYVRDKTINLRFGGGAYAYTSLPGLALDCPAGARALGCVPVNTGATTGKHWSTFTQAFDFRGLAGQNFFTTTDYNFFVQDTFKWRPSVTLNMGLRYEYQKLPDVPPVTIGGKVFQGHPDFPESQKLNQDTNNFGPRLAIAWDIGGKQKNVLRVGGGIYYGRTPNGIVRSGLVENGVVISTYQLSSARTAELAAGPVYPALLPRAPNLARLVSFLAGDYVRPFIMMVDAAYERELTRNISFSATYLFTRGNHLTHGSDINLPAPTTSVNILLNDGTLLGVVPFYAGLRPLLDSLTPIIPAPRLSTVNRETSNLNSIYHGAVFQVTQRARWGLTQTAHFTISKAQDEAANVMGQAAFAGSRRSDETLTDSFFDPQNRRREYARSDFDTRKRFVWLFIWEPNRVWSMTSSATRHILGDWSFSGVVTAQDGQPFQPFISGTISGTLTNAVDTRSINGSGAGTRAGWLPRNFLETTGFFTVDFRVQKDFRISESKRIRFLWEAFNLFNRTNHPNRFNFSSSSVFRTVSATTCASGASTLGCPSGSASNATLPRQVVLRLDSTFQGVLTDPVNGVGDLANCTTATCLFSASGQLFGARDMQFGVKFIW
jgi:hypothetical protein